METYDILMLIVLVATALYGAIKGFAWQLASLASIFVSYVVAYQFREPFSQSIQAEPPWNRFLAMLILYVGTSLVIWVAFRMISGTIDRLKLREFDRHVGAVFGLAKGALFCTLITLFAVTLLGDGLREKIVASKSGRYIAQVLVKSESVIPPEINQVVRPYLQRFDERFRGVDESNSGGVIPWIADRVSGEPNAQDRLPEAIWDVAAQAVDRRLSQPSGTQNQPSGNTYGQSAGYAQPSGSNSSGYPSAYGQPSVGDQYAQPRAQSTYGQQPAGSTYGQPPVYDRQPSAYGSSNNSTFSDPARPTYGRSFGQPSSYRGQ